MNSDSFLKRLALGAGVGLIAMVAYDGIQYSTIGRAVLRQDCWSWQCVSFNPAWVWPYESMFILAGLPWFLLPTLRDAQRFAVALLATAAVAWVVFVAYPTACVRPSTVGQPTYYVLLRVFDQANNCMPCLHSALSLVTAWSLVSEQTIFARFGGILSLVIWLAVVSVSIVALRQHTGVDIMAGFALGGVGAWLFSALRNHGPGGAIESAYPR